MKHFLIDFDSTFIKTESLEELSLLVLKNHPDRQKITDQIKQITDLGMEGKIDFGESLKRRLKLLDFTKSDLKKLVKILKTQISPSIQRNKKFFKDFADQIYIISGGFKEFIYPVVKDFGILEDHIFANQFIFDNKGQVTGFDTKNPLSQKGGKIQIAKSLNLDGEVIVIGDGFTDFEIKQMGYAHKFVAFIENIRREAAIKNADFQACNFDELLNYQKLSNPISFPKPQKVLLLENIDKLAVETFQKEGYRVELLAKALSEDELIEKIADISVLGVRSKTQITKKVLESANRLMAIGCFCIGTDQTDLKTASSKGIVVFNTPFSNTRSVVELVIGDIIMLLRGAADKSQKLHQGIWDKSAIGNFEIRGKTLGIIGYGNIGSQLSVLAENLGMNVIFYDIVDKLSLGNAKKASSIDEVFKKSDIITIHIDGRIENTNLIGHSQFAKMKNGVFFLNLSRGHIVDIEALNKALRSGKVAGAALDVFPYEPKSKDELLKLPLQGLPNVILTPHIGGSTEEAQVDIARYVSQKIIDFIHTRNAYMSVNLPNTILPSQKRRFRVLY